ncbi:MAG: hypothetical protein ACYTGC_03770 [Planctomycetota bacterium]|jgi:hypothetical protein
MGLRKTFLWSMIISLSLAALVGIAALVMPRFGIEERILGSTALFGAFSLVALMCATVLERRRMVACMWGGIASDALALLLWLALIWFERDMNGRQEEAVARLGGTFTVLAVGAAHVGLLRLPRFDRPSSDTVRHLTVGVAIVLGTYILSLIWWWDWIEDMVDDDFLVRGLGVLSILVACGTVVTPILWKMQTVRHEGEEESIPSRVDITLTCPRCRTEQTLRAGRRRCRQCGLRITIDVEEPRCACGYLLYRLESGRCPECGRPVTQADRWAVETAGDT